MRIRGACSQTQIAVTLAFVGLFATSVIRTDSGVRAWHSRKSD